MTDKNRVPADRRRLWIAIIGIVLTGVAGGSSRVDIVGLLALRPVLIILATMLLLGTVGLDVRRFRVLILLFAAFALSMAVQLIPLPPGLWLALPGHAAFAREAVALGTAQPWRPIALAPDLAWNSLFALAPVGFAIIVHMTVRAAAWRWFLIALLALAGLSVMLGLIQIVAGPFSPAYLYAATSRDLPVGLFANRNHQAVFLAAMLPMIAAWIALQVEVAPRRRPLAIGLGGGAALLLFIMVFVTGSRAGTVMGLVGALGFFILLPVRPALRGRHGRSLYWAGVVVAVVFVVGAVVFLGRAASVDRALEANELGDLRFQTLPVMLQITRDFFPVGIGWGAFDPVFRFYEPGYLLKPTYFNHAHNDLLEVALTGGLPGIAAVAAFLVWWAGRTIAIWRRPRHSSTWRGDILAQAGSIASAILLTASLVDYPLRTPFLAMMLTIACCWMTRPVQRDCI